MICAPDSTHRPCDCGADSPNCEVCDEQCLYRQACVEGKPTIRAAK